MAKLSQYAYSLGTRYNVDPSQYSFDNPYVGNEYLNSLSGWDTFSAWLGLGNKPGTLYSNQLRLADEWESQRALQLEEREYNSEGAQVERHNAAGLNPDLLGVSASTSSGASNVDPSGIPVAEPSDQLAAFGHLTGQVFQFALSAASGISGIMNASRGLDIQSLSAISNIESSERSNFLSSFPDIKDLLAGDAAKYALDSLDEDSIREILENGGFSDGDISGIFDYLSHGVNSGKYSSHYRSSRARRYAIDSIASFLESEDFESSVLNKLRSRESKKLESSEIIGKSKGLESFGDSQGFSFDGLSDIVSEIYEIQQKFSYQQDEANYIDGSIRSSSRTVIQETMDMLNKKSKKGVWWATAFLLGYNLLGSTSLSFGSKKGPNGKESSFSFGF